MPFRPSPWMKISEGKTQARVENLRKEHSKRQQPAPWKNRDGGLRQGTFFLGNSLASDTYHIISFLLSSPTSPSFSGIEQFGNQYQYNLPPCSLRSLPFSLLFPIGRLSLLSLFPTRSYLLLQLPHSCF
jgi:hypothetical protein